MVSTTLKVKFFAGDLTTAQVGFLKLVQIGKLVASLEQARLIDLWCPAVFSRLITAVHLRCSLAISTLSTIVQP